MDKRRTKRNRYDDLAQPDRETLEAFAELDRAEQLEIIRAIESPSKNRKLAKAERELSRRRAAAFRRYLKPADRE